MHTIWKSFFAAYYRQIFTSSFFLTSGSQQEAILPPRGTSGDVFLVVTMGEEEGLLASRG